MKLSSMLVSSPLAALLVTLLGAPALPAFAFAAAAFLLALACDDYGRAIHYPLLLAYPESVQHVMPAVEPARLPLAA